VLLDLSLLTLVAYSVIEYLVLWAALGLTTLLALAGIVLAKLLRWIVVVIPQVRSTIDRLVAKRPFIRHLISNLPYLSISAAQLLGLYIVENYSLSEGFAEAFRVTSYTVTVLVVLLVALSMRTAPAEIRGIIHLRRHMRQLKKELKELETIGDLQDQILALSEEIERADPDDVDEFRTELDLMIDDYYTRYPQYKKENRSQ
jgi:hypothetical protein